MHNYKSYEKIETVPPSSSPEAEVPRLWRKKALLVFLIMSSIVFVFTAICVGVEFLRPRSVQQEEKSGLSGTRSSDLIESVCNKTLYFEVCNSSLSAYPGVQQANMSELVRIAVELSLDDAKRIANFTLHLNGTKLDSRGAVEDCVEVLGDTADELNSSKSLLANPNWRQRIDDVKTWLSAAMTNPSTCIEGLEDMDVDVTIQGSMKHQVDHLTQLISNALAIVNYVSTVEKFQKISQKNRRLLTAWSILYAS